MMKKHTNENVERLMLKTTPEEDAILNSCVYLLQHNDILDCHRIARERAATILEEVSYREIFIGVLAQVMVRIVRQARVEYAEKNARSL